MAFLLFRDIERDNILSLVNNNNPVQVQFASIMSLICLVALVFMMFCFIYRAVTNKAVLSRHVILFGVGTLVLLAVQSVAYGSLTSLVTNEYYKGCPTCIAGSLNFIVLTFLVIFAGIYYIMCEKLFTRYGIGYVLK